MFIRVGLDRNLAILKVGDQNGGGNASHGSHLVVAPMVADL